MCMEQETYYLISLVEQLTNTPESGMGYQTK